ncbi:von Willebrand factor type A domain protein [Bacteriovorax sp. BAL6_X]|uniref:VWA domain-containing protein n=1 Tax=Bacteriovorax sp. BAL6_X TaxID=1201290 RepID=UPI00038616BB|nr:VWA domain-containing protein [Bacteriovorax sp. BAL6_X]EPZ50856.1 von Willebrand factor type A domain protein [Bacteriovorax sp. BAL6_X]
MYEALMNIQSFSLRLITNIDDFHFIRPWWLILLLFVTIFCYLYLRSKRMGELRNFFSADIFNALVVKQRGELLKDPQLWALALATVLIIAVSGPTFEKVRTSFDENESKTLLVINLSQSMDAIDVAPSRIDRAKIKIIDLLKLNQGPLFSLVVTGGDSFEILPYTRDFNILENFISALDTSLVPNDLLNFSTLNERLLNSFTPGAQAQNMILISDQIDESSIPILSKNLTDLDVNLIVYGVGKEEVELENNTFYSGHLKKLATITGGKFIEYSDDNSDIVQISAHLKSYYPLDRNENLPWHDLGYYLLFFALIPFVMYFRRGWIAVIHCYILFVCINPSNAKAYILLDPFMTADQQGALFFKLGDYRKAAIEYENQYNKAVSYYLAEDFKNAQLYFSQLNDPASKFANANSIAHMGYYLSAQVEYEKIIKMGGPYAKYAMVNAEIMKKLVAEIDATSSAQRAEGDEKAKLYREKFKVSRGAEVLDRKKQDIDESNKVLNIDLWINKVHSPLRDFIARKIEIISQDNEEVIDD